MEKERPALDMTSPADTRDHLFRPHLYWSLVGVFTVFSLVLLAVPFTRDQGIYGYAGWRWLEGDLPYRDAFEGKGPVLFAIYALGLALSHGAAWGINLFDVLARAATLVLAGRVAARAAGERAGIYAAVLTGLPLFGVFNFMWWNGHPETFMLPMLAGSSLLVLRRGRRDLIAAGMLSALAVLTKLTAAPHLWLLLWLAAAAGPKLKDRLAAAGLFALGFVLAGGLFVIYFAAAGAFQEFWEVTVIYNLVYSVVASGGGDPPLGGFWFVFFLLPALLPFMAAANAEDPRRRGALFLFIWLIESLLQVTGQGKYFVYHWVVLVPAMGSAAGAGLAGAERLLARRWRWAPRVAVAVLLFFTVGYARRYWTLEESMGVRAYLSGSLPAVEYQANFSTEDFRLVYNIAAADFASAATTPEETVLVFGHDPLVNLLARRASPTRFYHCLPLVFTPASTAASQMRGRWRREFIDRLRAQPPALIAIADQDQNPVISETSYQAARGFTEFWEWLNKNYEPAGEVGNFHFFGRK